jgi:thiol-disulfide isomerase/thioredoxin
MAKYINLNSNSLPSLNNNPSGLFSSVMTAGSRLNTNTMIIIGAVVLFSIIALFYYFYFVSPSTKKLFYPNNENVVAGSQGDSQVNNTAELLFFYADWCPHCKAAKPIWNELKSEYENKTINGYKIIFTEIDCTEESAEVEKLINQYSVEGYPTIKLLKDGQIIDYDAKPTKETLTKFLNTVL